MLALCIVLGLQGRERERQVGLSTGAGHKSGTKRIRKEHANSEQGTGGDRAVEMGLKPIGSAKDPSFGSTLSCFCWAGGCVQ